MPLPKFLGKKAGANGNSEKGGQPQISAASPDEPPRSTQAGAKSQGQRNMNLSVTGLLQQKQRKAREALNKLKALPQQTGLQWTPEHHSVLSENVRLLIDSTSDPEVTQNKDLDDEYDEGDGEDQDAEENLARQDGVDYEDNEGRNEATAQVTEQQQSLTPDNSHQGQKRRREENQDQSNGPHANSQTTQSRRPFKRSKLRTGITQHVLEEFEILRPQPLQFNFRSHPAEDRSDEWYIQQFRRLFRKLHDFAHDYFGLHDIDQGHFHQPWAAGMTPEFLRYVEDVATPDPMVGGWDPLLQNTIQRKWLIVGIIMRILEIQVFGADLWGAEPQEKELLLGLERALLNREGFARTALRSNAVRSILEQGAITTNFHSETAVLTAKVALLLKPLTFFLYSRPPRDGGMNRKIEDQYQALHNIIAIAAYLSICIRLSPTIFYFSSITPNTRYEEDEHHSLDEECYTKSREAVVKAYDAEVKAYADKKAELEKVVAKLKAAGKNDTNRVYKNAKEKLNAHIETEPYTPDRTYELMTKIGVWPNIGRYKPGTLEDDETGTPLEERRGFRIFDISKGAVVCYLGTEDRLKRAEQRVALEDFVKKKIKKYEEKDRGVGKGVVLAAAAAAAAAGIPYLLYGWTPAAR